MDVESRRALGSRYELVDRLGAGAMGEVWRARDRSTGGLVAAKVLRSELARDPDLVGRFVQERAILLRLTHPGIVRVHDLVVEGDQLAIVMDLVQGPDLGSLLRERGTLTGVEAVAMALGVLDALAAAHAIGCLHRDVKPDNVLLAVDAPEAGLGLEDVRLTDFGIARLAQESTVHATGLLGTPGYLPPELLTQGTVSAASDVYAAGVLLYELLAGRTPFAGPGTAHTLAYRHVTVAPPPLPVPAALWSVVAGMLEKDPTRRLSPAAAAEALRALPETEVPPTALPVQQPPATWTDAAAPVALPERAQVLPAGLDVGATNLHAGGPVADAPLADAGPAARLTPGGLGEALAGAEEGVTQIGRPAPSHRAARLDSAVAPTATATRRRWPWVAAALATVLAAGGLAVVLTRGGDAAPTEETAPSTTTGASGPLTATGQGEDHYSGLSVARQAEYDAEAGTVTLTLEYVAHGADLGGPFLEVVPVGDDRTCPTVTWDGAEVRPNQPTATGVSAPCGWSIDPGRLRNGDRVSIEAVVSTDLGDEPDLDAWLAQEEEGTRDALDAVRSGTAYLTQRIEGVELRTPLTVRRTTAGSPVLPLRVLPVLGGKADVADPLYVSPADGPATLLLQQVAGGYAGLSFQPCQALRLYPDGRTLGISSTGPCDLRVTVGAMDPAESSFTIYGATG